MPKPIEDLADALQRCFADAVRQGAAEACREIRDEMRSTRADGQKVREEMRTMRADVTARLDRQDATLKRQDATLARQNEALRFMWRQMKGNGKFPLD